MHPVPDETTQTGQEVKPHDDEVHEHLERTTSESNSAKLEAAQTSIQRVEIPSGGGTALPAGLSKQMEKSMGANFQDVRVHRGNTATKLGALAFTRGNDLHFGTGQYQPNTRAGQAMIGHELAHVVQQRAGHVNATSTVSGVPLNDNASLEAEADRMALEATATKP